MLQPQRPDLNADLAQVRGGSRAIHQRDPVQQEAGGERSQEEVLERGLRGGGAVAVDPGERVDRHGHQLEPEEHDHEILAADHEHRTQRREEQQRVVLGGEQALPLEVVERHQYGQARGAEQQPVRDEAEVVDRDHSRGADRARRVPPQPPRRCPRDREPRQGDPPRHPQVGGRAVPPRDQEQQHHAHQRERQLGEQCPEQVARVREVEAHRTAVNEAALSRTD